MITLPFCNVMMLSTWNPWRISTGFADETIIEIYSFSINLKGSELVHKPLALDGRVVQKILKRYFFQNIKYSFHGVTQIGVKPQQNFFSTNTGARGVQSFCVLESPNCLLIEQWLAF